MDELSGQLVVVATPIGNLGDLSTRARDVLADAAVICCEDTRRTRVLLSALGIPAARRLVSLHQHNEQSRAAWVVTRVAAGDCVCYVSDAGTPGVSDPGELLVREVIEAGLDVTVVPGPSAALAALVVSGLPTDRFCVEGFLPRRGADRARRLESLATEERTAILFEAPSRLAATLDDLLAAVGDRPCALCRELTKLHEQVVRGTVSSLVATIRDGEVPKGEIVLVLGGAEPAEVDDAQVAHAVRIELDAGATVRDAAARVATTLGVSKRRAYTEALRAEPGAAS
jgi:16S rRNA (cytidine1402-2'-O)-methyltransferase